jgi:hypothetical protein
MASKLQSLISIFKNCFTVCFGLFNVLNQLPKKIIILFSYYFFINITCLEDLILFFYPAVDLFLLLCAV